MGSGSRRYCRCRRRCGTGSARCWRTDQDFATGCFWRRRTAPRRPATMPRCETSPSLRLPSCPRASASSRPRRKDAPSSISPALHGIVDGLDRMISRLPGRHRLSRRGRHRQRRACDPARPDHARFLSRVGVELDIRRRAAGSSRADRQPARAGLAGAGRRQHRQTGAAASLDDLGSATFRADLASMRHETQYTRLFRS